MNQQDLTALINRNTEALNAVAKLQQRDPMREFVLGHSLKQNPTTYADVVEVLSMGQCFNPQTITSKKNATDTIITGDFKFQMPPRRIEVSCYTRVSGGVATLSSNVAIAFSLDGQRFSRAFRVPQIMNTSIPSPGNSMAQWSGRFDVCMPYVRIIVSFVTANATFPSDFLTPKDTRAEYIGSDPSLTLAAFY